MEPKRSITRWSIPTQHLRPIKDSLPGPRVVPKSSLATSVAPMNHAWTFHVPKKTASSVVKPGTPPRRIEDTLHRVKNGRVAKPSGQSIDRSKPCKYRDITGTVEHFEALVNLYHEYGDTVGIILGVSKTSTSPEECKRCPGCHPVLTRTETNMFGETVEKPRLMHEGLHHAHQLSDMVLKDWPPVPTPMRWKYFTNDQILACVEFSQLLNDKSPIPMFTRLGETELRNTTSEEMISILGCFNRLFFPGATLNFELNGLQILVYMDNVRTLTPIISEWSTSA
jgi:hypothetical protein